MHYYQATNPGTKDWITHEDNQIAYIAEYPPNLWVTENTAWAARVQATEITKEQAQIICDATISEARAEWEACISGSQDQSCGLEPRYIVLP